MIKKRRKILAFKKMFISFLIFINYKLVLTSIKKRSMRAFPSNSQFYSNFG